MIAGYIQGVPLNLASSLAVQTAQPSTPVASSPGRASTPGSPCSPAPATEEVPARGSPVSVHHGAAGRLMELTHLQQQAHATPSRLGQIDVVLVSVVINTSLTSPVLGEHKQ